MVATSIAVARYLQVNLTRKELAELCANSERYVGTAGGGMDQASICLSQKGTAQLISFNPLMAEAVPLPSDGVLVVCNSCREAPKAEHAATCYNKRVFELKLACVMIEKVRHPGIVVPDEDVPKLTLMSVHGEEVS